MDRKNAFVRLSFASLLLLGGAWLVGCHACEDLTEQICSDLGPEDCRVYKESGLAEKMLPSAGRGRNKTCSMMSSGPAYSGVLSGAKSAVAAQKAADAAAKKAAK